MPCPTWGLGCDDWHDWDDWDDWDDGAFSVYISLTSVCAMGVLYQHMRFTLHYTRQHCPRPRVPV